MSFVEGGLSDCATGSNVKLNHHYHSVSAVAASGSADFDGATASASASCSSSPSGASAVVVNRMPCGVISQPRLAAPGVMSLARSSKAVYTSSPGLSLALNSGGEGQGDGAAAGGVGGSGGGGSSSGAGAASFVGGSEYEQGKSRDEEYESRSGSDNVEGGASGDDQDADHRPRKKRYHRHTPQQIQELEALFKECPHPDEKQRADLSRRLNLETRQVKFWFQNRRTQMKTQLERHENSILRQENEKLRLENMSIKEAMRSPICSNCGGPAILGELSLEEQQLRIENARLKDELERLCVLTGKFFGRPIHPSISPPVAAAAAGAASHIAKSTLDLGVAMNPPLPSSSGQELRHTAAAAAAMPAAARVGLGIGVERSMMAELAVAAMDEFMKMAQAEEPLWLPSLDTGKDTLNYEDYMRQFPASITPKPIGLATEATRDTAMVMIRSLNLVDILMDVERWKEMFPCIISRAAVVEVISGGLGGTRNGALQLMYAELQVLSPLVPARELYFLRFCKQHAEGVWAVVDVSLDAMAASAAASTQTPQHQNQHLHLIKCRKFPSGCLIQELPRGSCKVTWVEHAEYDDREVHRLYRSLLSSGMAFGAQRWLATLQRQCDCLTVLVASRDSNNAGIPSPGGRRSMLKLAQRMTDNFCAGVSASTVHAWNKLSGNTDEDVRIMTRKSVDNPGEPPGVVLSAATSVWLPVSPHRLFQFLRDERLRSEWDILSNGGPMQEMTHIAKGQEPGNCVSLLRASGLNASHSSMLILQETCTDASGSLVVYAPVDIPAMQAVLTGGDPTYVALLPSGFAILPDGPDCRAGVAGAGGVSGEAGVGGSLLTVAFQILVNSLPTAKLSVESVETVNNLITCTVQKIKAALQCEDA